MNQFMSKGRRQQMRGKFKKLWGRLTHNPYCEFLGEQDIIEGKLDEYYARRSGDSHGALRPRTGKRYIGRRHDDLVA